tara:strand:+ start:4144 stop:4938 length:795 start_codon:yes stop_codon:yes gene_type:complete
MENYYKILGLKLGATLYEVEEKHSELLKEFDPKKQSDDDLKEFFSVECNKVKEAYDEICLSLIDNENIEQVVDEINSVTSEIDSENEDLDVSPIKELIDESHEKKRDISSISSEKNLKLKRACLIMFIFFFLFSLYGWSSFSTLKDDKDYWYNRYEEIKSGVSGDDYDSGCDKEIRLKLHNHTYQTLRFYVSWKEKNGEWTKWGYWDVNSKEYKRYGLNNWDSEPLYASDYRYYITTTDDKKYTHSRDAPHLTNTCNAKCINIY